jgi:hypothetical protein
MSDQAPEIAETPKSSVPPPAADNGDGHGHDHDDHGHDDAHGEH